MKILYLAAGNGLLKYEDVTYQDLIIKRDLGGDMLNIDLTLYDLIVATPPCNFWSKASGNKTSQYALDTKNLLPKILEKLIFSHKPYIVENVINKRRMIEHGILPFYQMLYHTVGRHSYFTNINVDLSQIKQDYDFKYGGYLLVPRIEQQGGSNVKEVLEFIIDQYISNKEDVATRIVKHYIEMLKGVRS